MDHNQMQVEEVKVMIRDMTQFLHLTIRMLAISLYVYTKWNNNKKLMKENILLHLIEIIE